MEWVAHLQTHIDNTLYIFYDKEKYYDSVLISHLQTNGTTYVVK